MPRSAGSLNVHSTAGPPQAPSLSDLLQLVLCSVPGLVVLCQSWAHLHLAHPVGPEPDDFRRQEALPAPCGTILAPMPAAS